MIILPQNRIYKQIHSFYRFMSLYSSSSVVQSLDYCPNYVELRTTMQNLAVSGNIDKSLQVFHSMRIVSGKPTVYDFNSLLNCYLKSKNVNLNDISSLYMEMKRIQLSPNGPTFNTFLKGLNIVGESKIALLVIGEMCNYGIAPSFTCLSNVLKKCLDSMDLVDAISVVELMLELNYIPTEPKISLLIKSLSEYGSTRDACLVYFKLLEKGYFQKPYIYNPILWSLCKSSKINDALGFFCLLKKKGIVHNVCSYTALVYGFCIKRLFKQAFNCLKIMEVDSGCYANVKTYTIILKFLCDYGRLKEALKLLGDMEKRGVNLDVVTYNVIIRALSHENMVLEVYEIFERIYQKGICPDRYTATALAGLLKRGSLVILHSLLRDIFFSDSEMDVAVYNVYFNCLFYARDLEESLSLIRLMMENGIEPNNITFNTILKGFCEEKTMDEVIEFFERVEWPEKRPDLVSFNTILSAACKKVDSSMVQRVVDLMENEGVRFNVVGLTCLMQYFCNVGNVNDCLKVFEHMICYGPRPTMVTVNTLITGLCKNHEIGAAYRVFCNLKNWDLSPNSRTYDILIRAAMSERHYYLVDELKRKYLGK